MNREMNEDELSIYIQLISAKEDQTLELYEEMKDKSWVLQAIEKRAIAWSLDIDRRTQIMILTIGDGVIGHCVKYIDVVKKWADLEGTTNISLETFSTKIFPFGFPDFKTT